MMNASIHHTCVCWFPAAAIRVAARWYTKHLAGVGSYSVLLVSEDQANRARAAAEGLPANSGECQRGGEALLG